MELSIYSNVFAVADSLNHKLTFSQFNIYALLMYRNMYFIYMLILTYRQYYILFYISIMYRIYKIIWRTRKKNDL